MSLLPNPDSCCSVCDPAPTVSIPGPAGPAGADGTNGTDGIDAYTTASSFTVPAELANTPSISVGNSEWMAVGSVIFASGGAFVGYFEVVSKADSTHVVLKNLEDTGSGAYSGNSPPGSVFPNGTALEPGGPQGPSGPAAPGGTYFAIANNLSEGTAATMRGNLGLGTVATFTEGVANTRVPSINDAGGIGNNEFVTGTGTGIQGRTAAQARGDLGLGTAALKTAGNADTNVPVVDDGAGLTNGESLWATATGVESVTATIARGRLGVNADAMLLFQDQEIASDAGTFTSGDWRQVPLNTEVVDTGGNGSIAAGQITLAAGTYRYEYVVIGYECDEFQGRLYNISDAAVISNSYGTSALAPAATALNMTSTAAGRFTIATSKTIELQAQCKTTKATSGFGHNIGGTFTDFVNQVYSYIILWKE